MTETPKGLATLALLKTRFDEGRDHLELLEPFVADAVVPSLPTYVRHGARKELE